MLGTDQSINCFFARYVQNYHKSVGLSESYDMLKLEFCNDDTVCCFDNK